MSNDYRYMIPFVSTNRVTDLVSKVVALDLKHTSLGLRGPQKKKSGEKFSSIDCHLKLLWCVVLRKLCPSWVGAKPNYKWQPFEGAKMLNAAKIGVLGGWKKRRKLCCPAHNAPVSKAALAQVRLNLAHLGCRPLEVPGEGDGHCEPHAFLRWGL